MTAVFSSAQGIDEKGVISDQSELESSLRKLMIEHAWKNYFLFDGSKYGKRFAFKICTAHDISGIVTDLEEVTFNLDKE